MTTRHYAVVAAALVATAGGGLLLGTSAAKPSGAARSTATIAFVDVGAGDAVAMKIGGKVILSDAGEFNLEKLAATLRGDLRAQRIDYAILSHPHDDHIKNFGALARLHHDLPIKVAYRSENEGWTLGKTNREVLQELGDHSTKVRLTYEGRRYRWGGARWTILHPPKNEWTKRGQEGNASIAFLLDVNGRRILFTGDIKKGVASALAASGALPDVDVLLVTHHGSDDGSRNDFLEVTKPEWAVVSVGAGHGHPAVESMRRIHKNGATIWCTATNGTITLTISPSGGIDWKTETDRQPEAWWLRNERRTRGMCVDKRVDD